jgi:CBS domain-containing protein
MQLISEIMTYDAAVVSPADSVRQAQKKMDAWNIHAVPVCEAYKLVGILSQHDIAKLACDPTLNLQEKTVASIMTEQVLYCFEDQSVDEVLQQMSRHRIRHMPVLNRNKVLTGIVSLSDLANRATGLSREHAQELFQAFGSEQLSTAEIRTHRLASGLADGKF